MIPGPIISPGETIGILGGGQLGRMLAMAAAQLGYRVHVFSPERESIAADVAAQHTCAAWDDAAAMARFAADCAVVTFEFENVPVGPLAALDDAMLLPMAGALEVAQDRLVEKRFVQQLGGTPARFLAVEPEHDLAEAVAVVGAPGILKTRRDGYDGKGQWRFASADEAAGFDHSGKSLIYEGFVDFLAEFSVLLCRGRDGDIRFWDTPQNSHAGGILSRSVVPAAPVVLEQVGTARDLATRVATALDYTGVLTLEFFATEGGPVFNEMAPRVHNSGHWTIEGALTSQFENHIRAICHLHLYGKAAARAGRKMGHVTRLVL
jgi:5-(carboxyamino)imidazole ribonucleotide synthase